MPAVSRSARLTDSSQDHYSPFDMSVSAQAIADREAETARLQAAIKALADVDRLLGASAAPSVRVWRSSRLRTAAAATAESKSDAKPPRKRPPMSPLPLLQVADGRRSRSANTDGPEQLVIGRGRKSGRSVSTPCGRGGQRASTTGISPATSLTRRREGSAELRAGRLTEAPFIGTHASPCGVGAVRIDSRGGAGGRPPRRSA